MAALKSGAELASSSPSNVMRAMPFVTSAVALKAIRFSFESKA
jgi:hypothetical protein